MDNGVLVIGFFAALIAIAIIVYLFQKSRPTASHGLEYCPHCGTVGEPEFYMAGSTVIEVLLWLFFLVSGLIYSIWCNSTKCWLCPKCGPTGMIPIDSPIAQKALGARLGN